MKVNDVMTTDVQCCMVNSSLDEIASKMWQGSCGAIPVVDKDARPVGMITDRDIAMSCTLNHKAPWELQASTVIGERELFTCSKDDSVDIALSIMKDRKVRRLPVTDNLGHLVGMLSIDDIVARSSKGKLAQNIPYDVTMTTLKAVAFHH